VASFSFVVEAPNNLPSCEITAPLTGTNGPGGEPLLLSGLVPTEAAQSGAALRPFELDAWSLAATLSPLEDPAPASPGRIRSGGRGPAGLAEGVGPSGIQISTGSGDAAGPEGAGGAAGAGATAAISSAPTASDPRQVRRPMAMEVERS
jgi:hypothetical protein